MNIWVIGRSYPLMLNNMQGSFELEQAKMLAKHGQNVSYLACVFHPFKKVKKWGFCKWNEDNMHVYTNSQFYAHERMKLHLELFKAYIWKKFLSRVEQETGIPDVIHVHYPANITVARLILAYQKKGTKIICTEHWTQVLNQTIDAYERKQLKEYVDNANAFLCVGVPLKNAIEEITQTAKSVYVIPNIANSLFEVRKKENTIYNFIAVGAVIPHKQFDKIIEAFGAVFKDVHDVKLTIVGNGVELGNLKKLVSKMALNEQVKFTGELKREETADYVANSDALVCYSRCETFGVPIIEAWSCGIPVIATTAAAVIDNWNDRLGIEISPDDISQLKEAMKDIYINRMNYSKEYISNFSEEHFSEEKVYSMLLKYYQKE